MTQEELDQTFSNILNNSVRYTVVSPHIVLLNTLPKISPFIV